MKSDNTLYLSSLAGLSSSAAVLLALAYFKPNNLGQNDLHHDWKSLSFISAVGGLLGCHYGVTNESIVFTMWKSARTMFLR
jgi:hypothetical protein